MMETMVAIASNYRYRYRAFGERVTLSGGAPGRTDPSFQNRTYDAGLGIYDYRNRCFDPATGRFLQRDPVLGGDPLYNPYCFPSNNPVTNSDPMGTDYIDVDDKDDVIWVIQNPDRPAFKRRHKIGHKSGPGGVNIDEEWGGTSGLDMGNLKMEAGHMVALNPLLILMSEDEQKHKIKNAIHRAATANVAHTPSMTPGFDAGIAISTGALKTIKEPVLWVADVSVASYNLAADDNLPMHSMMGRSEEAEINQGHSVARTASLGVVRTGANMITAGMESQAEMTYAYMHGEMNDQQYREGMYEAAGGAVVALAVSARARAGGGGPRAAASQVADEAQAQSPKPGPQTKVLELPEKSAPVPVSPEEVAGRIKSFLGPNERPGIHPRTGAPAPYRITSQEGTRSIRCGPHEMKSSNTNLHYHEETWSYDPATDTMTYQSTLVRTPVQTSGGQ